MTLYFDGTIFLYALYVCFVYALLAFGALLYRQYIDDDSVKSIRLGEDIIRAINPYGYFAISVFFALLCATATAALLNPEPSVILYVAPMSAGINIIQMSIRMLKQTTDIRSDGILVRYLLKDAAIGIRYEDLVRIHSRKFGIWNVIEFYEFPTEPKAKCLMPAKAAEALKRKAALHGCDFVQK